MFTQLASISSDKKQRLFEPFTCDLFSRKQLINEERFQTSCEQFVCDITEQRTFLIYRLNANAIAKQLTVAKVCSR